jgi:sialate O-acetylesterase
MRRDRTFLLLGGFVLWWTGGDARAEVRLPAVISSRMVLQQKSEVALWGTAAPGETVKVSASWGGDAATAKADESGRWKLLLATPAAGGPFTIDVAGDAAGSGPSGEGAAIRLEDVLVGEVWLCGGQSNMEWAFANGGVLDGDAERAAANDPQVRLFDVPNVVAATPQGDCSASWRAVTPDSVNGFSCIGWFFARELRKALGVPVGLIGVNWGGTVAQAWVRREALAAFPRLAPELAWVEREAKEPSDPAKVAAQAWAGWFAQLDAIDLGLKNGWEKSDFDDSNWETALQPGLWRGELQGFDGVLWMRRTFEIPKELAGLDLELQLGPIDDMDSVWLEGSKLGGLEVHGVWTRPRRYRIPAAQASAGRHVLAVRVVDTGGEGGFAGAPADLALVRAADPAAPAGAAAPGGLRVELAGEWRQRVSLAASAFPPWPQVAVLHPNVASVLWNGLVAPIVPFGIRGALWYQGESNRGFAAEYAQLMPALIADWRARFERPAFPFYFVQIAPYDYGDGSDRATAELRQAQLETLRVEHTGMVVTTDVGDPHDIHPANKLEVGRRLARWALAGTYGQALECSGPLFESQQAEGAAVHVRFTHAGGLASRDGKALSGFELRGADGAWHPAKAAIDGESVLVTSDAVAQPAEARFGHADSPQLNLVNGAGLPASPFCRIGG